MTKGIHQVRRAIKKRKRQRQQVTSEIKYHSMPPLIQEEEKHGFQPAVLDYEQKGKKPNKFKVSNMTAKLFICIACFVSTSFILSTEKEQLRPAKSWLTSQLQEDFPFAKASAWYETTFGGTPLSIAPQGRKPAVESQQTMLPVMGQVVETFQTNGKGIMISPEETTTVGSIDDGVVIFAGKDKETAKTIIIQHADGTNTTYGHLEEVDVHAYQQVQADERIGTFSPTKSNEVVYFSIEKDNEYIDPAKVIPVDDLP